MQPAASQSFDIYEKVISCFLSKKLTHVYLVLYFFFSVFWESCFLCCDALWRVQTLKCIIRQGLVYGPFLYNIVK